MKTPNQTTPERRVNYGQWAAIIVLALSAIGYALISYGRQQEINTALENALKEKVSREVFVITVESVNDRLKDIKANTDQIPDLKAKIEAHINKEKR